MLLLRHVAALTRVERAVRRPTAIGRIAGLGRIALTGRAANVGLIGALVLIAVCVLAPAVWAADPTPSPDGDRPRTCAERFPEEGPAGVDLKLGCIVGQVVGLYSTAATSKPAPLSTYAIVIGVLVACGLAAVWLVGRLVSRKAGERMAPVLAGEWWVCAKCRSVNGAGVTRCYSCGSPPPDGPMMRTSDDPGTPQSFGRTRKSG